MTIDQSRALFADAAHFKTYIKQITAINTRLNALVQINDALPSPTTANGDSALRHAPFAIKDNIALAGMQLTCASNMLKNFTAPYTATAVQKLLDGGAIPVAKTNLDEYGMGSSTQQSTFGATCNPWDEQRVCGGSSGGSAVSVAAGLVPFALGSDTGGSIRQPASFCGVYGLKPTYGAISRFGLVAYASSLETIGIFATTPADLKTVFDRVVGADPLDQTTHAYQPPQNSNPITACTVGYLRNLPATDTTIRRAYTEMIVALKGLGVTCVAVDIPYETVICPAYYTIATAEASANLARYDGVKYGHRGAVTINPQEMTKNARSEGFGAEVKLRILLGSYVLRSGFQKQYYLRAQEIRSCLKRKMHDLFQRIDLLAMPTFPTLPFYAGEKGLTPFQQKQADMFTCLANLTEHPALAIPVAMHESLPIGMQFLARPDEEQLLFAMAEAYRAIFTVGAPPRSFNPQTVLGDT